LKTSSEEIIRTYEGGNSDQLRTSLTRWVNRDLYIIKKGYRQDSSMLEDVIVSITDRDVKTLKTNGKRQLQRRRSGKMVYKNISETAQLLFQQNALVY
jgi:hypothetical protein